MAAKHVARRSPVDGDALFLPCGDNNSNSKFSWCARGRVVEEFVMEQPVPPYLFAFAVGELDNREVGPRTRVYAEAVPHVLDSAGREFAGSEDMIREGERFLDPMSGRGLICWFCHLVFLMGAWRIQGWCS